MAVQWQEGKIRLPSFCTIPGLLPGRCSCKFTRLMNLLRLSTFDLDRAADARGSSHWCNFLLAGWACLATGTTAMAAVPAGLVPM